jgi:hypothetical protein
MNCYSGIFPTIYRSYWYQSRFLWDIRGKLQDLGISFRKKLQTLVMEDEFFRNP